MSNPINRDRSFFQKPFFQKFVQNRSTNGLGAPGLNFFNFFLLSYPDLTRMWERESERERKKLKDLNTCKARVAPTCTYIKFKYSVIVTFLFKVYAVLREQWICPERPNRESFCFISLKTVFEHVPRNRSNFHEHKSAKD